METALLVPINKTSKCNKAENGEGFTHSCNWAKAISLPPYLIDECYNYCIVIRRRLCMKSVQYKHKNVRINFRTGITVVASSHISDSEEEKEITFS